MLQLGNNDGGGGGSNTTTVKGNKGRVHFARFFVLHQTTALAPTQPGPVTPGTHWLSGSTPAFGIYAHVVTLHAGHEFEVGTAQDNQPGLTPKQTRQESRPALSIPQYGAQPRRYLATSASSAPRVSAPSYSICMHVPGFQAALTTLGCERPYPTIGEVQLKPKLASPRTAPHSSIFGNSSSRYAHRVTYAPKVDVDDAHLVEARADASTPRRSLSHPVDRADLLLVADARHVPIQLGSVRQSDAEH